jgi:hypothetical protein
MKENKMSNKMFAFSIVFVAVVMMIVMFAFVSSVSHDRSQTLIESCIENNGQIIQNENTTLGCLLPPGVLPSDY